MLNLCKALDNVKLRIQTDGSKLTYSEADADWIKTEATDIIAQHPEFSVISIITNNANKITIEFK